MTRQDIMRLIKNEPYRVGQWVGFNDLTELHNKWLRLFLFSKDDVTLLGHRGSYKTTVLSLFLALNIVIYPNKTVLFFRKTDTDVQVVIKQVAKILESGCMQMIINKLYNGKPYYKPDNRIAVNFAKYIVDVFNGFFIGNPIKVETLDDTVKAYVETLEAYNIQDDLNSELSKTSSIYGKAYELYYVDDSANICVAVSSPTNSVMVYDDGIVPRPKYFIRYYKGADNIERGSFSDSEKVYYFENNGTLKIDWDGGRTHGFKYVPANEMCDNDERQGVFESEMPMIDAYNKAISEKANDVDAFADAYLKVLGPRLEEEETRTIRQDRIINIETDNMSGVDVDFMQKPSADTTQENLINRLERLIFNISMVANISDENFATSSGIALRYKLKAMSDLRGDLSIIIREKQSGLIRR